MTDIEDLHHNICIWKKESSCEDCSLSSKVNCRFSQRELTMFLGSFAPFAITVTIGLVNRMNWIPYLIWFVYCGLFFNLIEIRILCSHCPFYAENSMFMTCNANYKSLKVWKYQPGPLSSWEKTLVILGFLFLSGYPVVFLYSSGMVLLALVAAFFVAFFFTRTKLQTCTKCVNFSCPLNGVPKSTVDEFLRKNSVMKRAWVDRGYRLD